MLVLSRKIDEEIYIGNVKVKVLQLTNGKVRLGIEANEEIIITRGEHREANERRELEERLAKKGGLDESTKTN